MTSVASSRRRRWSMRTFVSRTNVNRRPRGPSCPRGCEASPRGTDRGRTWRRRRGGSARRWRLPFAPPRGGGVRNACRRALSASDAPRDVTLHQLVSRRMTHDFTTDQREREATGSHAYGRYLEEFEEGAIYKHWPAKTVTEADDHLFCLITMNHHPLHINDVYAGKSQQGRNVVVGPLVYSLALGMSVSDVSGKAIANLATEELSHPAPVFHGDTLFVESEVLEKRESRSKPDRGTVKVHTRVFNQDGTLVAEFKRLVLVPRRDPGSPSNGGDEPGAVSAPSGD